MRSSIRTIALLLLLCCAVLVPRDLLAQLSLTNVNAGRVAFQVTTNFLASIASNELLEISQIDVVKIADGQEYLLALGITVNLAKGEPTPQAALDTRTVATAKARKQAAVFLAGSVTSTQKLTEIRQLEKITSDKGLQSRVERLTRFREEYIVERAEAVLPRAMNVATWFNTDRSLFYSVLAVPLQKK